ncbi:hypothetical protein [Streptomyces phaeolivaceus]|uniref:hypothetical protein n=1 Tax=Streptomyces phaeolivaceus TaxID=2653200 RepID=UPI00186AA95D|nr:hypothetical protein [Streptomyces phaeolivaceus]
MTAVSVGPPRRRTPAAAAHDPGWSVHDTPSAGMDVDVDMDMDRSPDAVRLP